MQLSNDCLKSMCTIAIGATALASGFAGISVASGAMEIMTASGHLALDLRKEQQKEFDSLERQVRKKVERDYKIWLKHECGDDWAMRADVNAALTQLDDALHRTRPTVADMVNAAHNPVVLVETLIERLPESSLYRSEEVATGVFAAIITGLHGLARTDDKLKPLLDTLSWQKALTALEELKDGQAKILDAIHNNTGIPMRTLEPIFEAIEEEFPEQDIEAKVKEAVQRLQALADQKIDVGNLGDDIRKLIESARIQLIDSPDIEEATAAFEEEFSKAEGQMLRAAALAKEKARMFAAVFRFDDAIRHFELAARYNPDDACPWFNIGDIRKSRGNLVAALAEYEKGKAIAERTGKERDLSVSHNRIGDVERARGNTEAALAAYQAELVIVKELAAQDPTNSEWQRDLSVSHERIGDVKASRGNDVAALAAFKDSLVIREKLAVQNPTNNEWQRDLSVSHNKIGDVERARGNVEAALAAYQVGLVIVEKLVGQDPINSEWQRDLSISYNKIGDVEASRGNGGAALAAYRSGFAIREKLVAQDPTNSGWQYDIFSSNWRIADLEPDPSKKIEYLTAGLERLEALHAENRLPPIHVRWIEKTKDWIDSIKGE